MAADDPYRVLGLQRDATEDEIRSAYRTLAKQHHPDLNPGKPEAAERFKAVAAAYDLLSDPERRGRYDRGEIDASGAERPDRPFYRDFGEGSEANKYRPGEQAFGDADADDLFATFFGGRRGAAGGVRMRGSDLRYALTVDFLEAAKGARRRLALPDGRTLDVAIPAGIDDGQTLRLKGQGGPGLGGGPAGDALIEVRVAPHPFFRRDGDDIRVDVPVTVPEAVLGGRIRVPTIDGPVVMTVPKHSDTGRVLRLKGKGLPRRSGGGRGDQYVVLTIVLGGAPDAELEEFVRTWGPKQPRNPRDGMVTP